MNINVIFAGLQDYSKSFHSNKNSVIIQIIYMYHRESNMTMLLFQEYFGARFK